MYTPDDPLNHLSPEVRKQVEKTLQSLSSNSFQNPSIISENTLDTLSPEQRQKVEEALRSFNFQGFQNPSVVSYETLDTLSPEQRQQIEEKLHSSGSNPFQNRTIINNDTLNTLPSDKRQRIEDIFRIFENDGAQDLQQASNDALDALPPDKRQRIEGVLHSLRENGLQNIEQINVVQHNNAFEIDKQVWAHWEYTEKEWALFDTLDWNKIHRPFMLITRVAPLISLLIIGIMVWKFSSTKPALVLLAAVFLGIALIISASVTYDAHAEAKKRQQARQKQPRHITISEKGIWEAGTYFPINDISTELTQIEMTFQPSVLHIKYRSRISLKGQSGHGKLHILIPHGHENEAVQLVKRFRTEVIETGKKGFQPPEPI